MNNLKKALFIVVWCIFAQNVFSQSPISQGSKLIDGTIMVRSQSGKLYQNAKGDEQFLLTMNGGVYYFLINNFALGAGIPVSYLSIGDYTAGSVGIAPALYYFFGNANNEESRGRAYPFLTAQYGYESASIKDSVSLYSATLVTLSAAVGFVYMLNNNVGLSARFGYQFEAYTSLGHSLTGKQYFGLGGIAIFIR